jgi:hypothetical protein
MKPRWWLLTVLAIAMLRMADGRPDWPDASAPLLRFRPQEIETGLKVGYAVLLVDIDGDGKKDIVVADTTRVVWYQNPTWKRRTIIQGQTQPDNVCLAAYDIDGDGRLDLALGAGWKPSDTRGGGTLQWLKQGPGLDEPWTLYPIASEPTLHRIRFADVDVDGKPELLVAPLMGRGSSARNNWLDGEPVRVLAFKIPNDPARDRWVPEVLDHSLHVVHNFWPVPAASGAGADVLTASYEGVSLLSRHEGRWTRRLLGAGNQETPQRNRGASEVKTGQLRNGRRFIGTIEPWHGHQVVVYTPPTDAGQKLWDRHVLDERLRWGHAVWCADLDGDGDDELIIGVRDDLRPSPGERRGVRVYKALDGSATRWARQVIEDGGVAVEDLAAADLDGDGKVDIVAVGRQTGNIRIYWNRGRK